MDLILNGDEMDPGIVLGWMLFPHDERLRKLYLVRARLGVILETSEPDDRLQIPAGLMETILAGPGRQQLREMAAEATKRGTVAGDMLGLMMEQHHLGKTASKEKAVNLYKKFALGKRYGDGEPLKISRATLLGYFDEFRPVAHLWAAQRLNQFSSKPVDAFGSAPGLAVLLGVAKTLGNFAAAYVPGHVKPPVSLIPANLLLRIPDEIRARHVPWGANSGAAPI